MITLYRSKFFFIVYPSEECFRLADSMEDNGPYAASDQKSTAGYAASYYSEQCKDTVRYLDQYERFMFLDQETAIAGLRAVKIISESGIVGFIRLEHRIDLEKIEIHTD